MSENNNPDNAIKIQRVISESDSSIDSRTSAEILIDKKEGSILKDNIENQKNVIDYDNEFDDDQERVYWIDCLKIFVGILCVYYSVTFFNVKKGDIKSHRWNGLTFYNCLFISWAPLYIMIYGKFLLNPNNNITVKKLYKKYILRLVICVIFWDLYYNIVDTYIVNCNRKDYSFSFDLIKDAIYNIIYANANDKLWFIFYVIGYHIITPILRTVTKNITVSWYAVAISIFVYQFARFVVDIFSVFIRFNIDGITTFVGKLMIEMKGTYAVFFLLGYLLYTHEFKKKSWIYISYLLGFVSLIITVVITFADCILTDTERSIFSTFDSFNVSVTAIATYLFFRFTISQWIKPLIKIDMIKSLIRSISDCTLGIYLTHMMIYNILHRFNFHTVTLEPYYWVPVYGGIVYLISLIFVFILRKIPFVKYIV